MRIFSDLVADCDTIQQRLDNRFGKFGLLLQTFKQKLAFSDVFVNAKNAKDFVVLIYERNLGCTKQN